jgi:hypothetical protein
MPSTTNQFGWSDRDTAARNMLQFATYAPPSIRLRALQLLEAFSSPSILAELKQIVFDEGRNSWERLYSLRAIASIRGDIYLPEFEPLLARTLSSNDSYGGICFPQSNQLSISDYGRLEFADFLGLFSNHPSNLQWAFHAIEQLPPIDYLAVLTRSVSYFHDGIDLNPILCRRMIDVLEQNPLLFTIDHIETLYSVDGSETTLQWLRERWDTILYLCLFAKVDEYFYLLEGWDELREAFFKQCPACIEEYEQKKSEVEAHRLNSPFAPVDYQSSPIWQELNGWYQGALEGDKQAYGKLMRVVYHERKNLSKRAIATNLLGKLKDKYDVRDPLFHALRYAPDDEQYQFVSMNTSIRFEAGEALRDIPSPDVWETMIDAFFIRPRNVLESFLSDWIAYQTDRLSGIETPYSGIMFGDENRRFWFRALVEPNVAQNSDQPS